MRILYTSVHEILEYDELRIFRDLGHDVFSLGTYFDAQGSGIYRPPLDLGPENAALREQFFAMGCQRGQDGLRLTPEWVALFDVCVVMHDVQAVADLWSALHIRPVYLRLIGQFLPNLEVHAAPYRALGLSVVRYSPSEMLADDYVAGDAIIRFGKYADDYGPWSGGDTRVLTFANGFRSRFPEEFARYRRVTAGLHPALGGANNEGSEIDIGLVSLNEQRALLRRCALYLYCSGTSIPYTLNFIEAWLSGIPVVVLDSGPQRNRFFEVPHLIQHGVDGFVCSGDEEARAVITALQADPDLGARIGRAGRESASSLFGNERIKAQWQSLFAALPHQE